MLERAAREMAAAVVRMSHANPEVPATGRHSNIENLALTCPDLGRDDESGRRESNPHDQGFFGRLDQHKNLVWVVYLENSNPFVDVSISNTSATFTSSASVSITVNLGTD